MSYNHGLLLILSGCSGTGKNTVLKELLKTRPELSYSISATTRAPRPGEIDGRDYFFLSVGDFLAAESAEEFLETARVFDHFYGTPKRFIEGMSALNRDVILDIDIAGALNVRRKKPEAVLIFLLPPSLEVLQHRLIGRGTDAAAEIKKRLAQVDVELAALKQYDYVVVNRSIEEASGLISCILVAETCSVRRQNTSELIQSLRKKGEEGQEPHDLSTTR